MKFEIDQLVNEILDKLPEEVWTNPNTTFLDPSAGGGQFVKEIEKRLISYGHKNVSNRVFGFFDSNIELNYAKNKHSLNSQLFITSIDDIDNLISEKLNNMKFDVIVGNPPFQWSDEESGKQRRNNRENLWSRFLFKSYSLLKENGVFSLIIPSSWTSPSYDLGRKRVIDDIFKKHNVIYVDINNCSKYFPSQGSTFTFFVVEKSALNNKKTPINIGSECIDIDFSSIDFLPSILDKNVFNISEKFFKDRKKLGMNNQLGLKLVGETFYKEHRRGFNVKAYHTASKTGWRFYSKKSDEHEKRKVLISISGRYSPLLDDEGNLSQTIMNMPYLLGDKESGKYAIQVFNSKLYTFIIDKAYRYNGWINTRIISNLPALDFTRSWNDQQIYEYFNLTQEEIDYIEANV